MIIGHRKNLDFLETAMGCGQLSHAYCFVGPNQIGKRTVARHIAAKLLKTEPEKLGVHPDFFYIEREVDEKKNRLKKDISVAQAKLIRNFLQNKSWLTGGKVVLVDEAEAINEEAANALLKTLEEATENSLIILLTVNDKLLPETVRSRCQIIQFDYLSAEEIAGGLRQLGHGEELSQKVAALAWGRPGRAIGLVSEAGAIGDIELEISRAKSLVNAPFYKKLEATESLFGDKDDAIRGRDRLREILDIWIMLWRDAMRGEPVFGGGSPYDAAAMINELQTTRGLLGQNIHPRLLMERILLKIHPVK
jgi:DNA polymerase-3 subunit delta'